MRSTTTFYPPSPALAEHVIGYIVRRPTLPDDPAIVTPLCHFPANMYATLTLTHRGRLLASRDGEAAPRAVLSGALTKHVVRQYVDAETTTVLFRPGRLADFARVRATHFTDTWVDAGTVLNAREQQDLAEVIGEQESVARRLHLLEAVLERRLAPTINSRGMGLARSLQKLVWQLPHLPVGALAADVGVSERQLRRLVADTFGVTPAMLLRLSRLQLCLLKLQRLRPEARRKLAEVADQCGYADAGHMARELRALTGFTPGAIRDEMKPPSRYSWAFELPQDLLHPQSFEEAPPLAAAA